MHTIKGKKTTFTHHLDLSGEIIIQTDKGKLKVDSSDIINFVLEHFRQEKIGQLEEMNFSQLKNLVVNDLNQVSQKK